MTTRPPRLAVWLLERFALDCESLVGDLLEEFEVRQSAWWMWRQTISALGVSLLRSGRDVRPLKLVDAAPLASLRRARFESRVLRPVNLSASPVHGVGGLGLVSLGVLVVMSGTQILGLLATSMIGGALLGAVLVTLTHRRVQSDTPTTAHVLFVE